MINRMMEAKKDRQSFESSFVNVWPSAVEISSADDDLGNKLPAPEQPTEKRIRSDAKDA